MCNYEGLRLGQLAIGNGIRPEGDLTLQNFLSFPFAILARKVALNLPKGQIHPPLRVKTSPNLEPLLL
jgi:hypothetical protein